MTEPEWRSSFPGRHSFPGCQTGMARRCRTNHRPRPVPAAAHHRIWPPPDALRPNRNARPAWQSGRRRAPIHDMRQIRASRQTPNRNDPRSGLARHRDCPRQSRVEPQFIRQRARRGDARGAKSSAVTRAPCSPGLSCRHRNDIADGGHPIHRPAPIRSPQSHAGDWSRRVARPGCIPASVG